MKGFFVAGSLITSLFFAVSSASAVTVTVVHGINGKDRGLAEQLPVDVEVNGSCALKGLSYLNTTRVELPAGTYQVKISPSNGMCSAPPLIATKVDISDAQKLVALVAHLNENGLPQLSAFDNTVSVDGVNRPLRYAVFLYHAAATREVNRSYTLRRMGGNDPIPVSNGQGGYLFGSYTPERFSAQMVQFRSGSARGRTLAKYNGRFRGRVALYMVGSQRNGYRLIVEDLPF